MNMTQYINEITDIKIYFLLNVYSIKSKGFTLYQAILQILYNCRQESLGYILWIFIVLGAALEDDRQKRHLKKLQIAITWNDTDTTFFAMESFIGYR